MPRRAAPLLLVLFAALLAGGCPRFRPAPVPLRTVEIKPASPAARSLVVLLPGRRNRPEDFARAGFGKLAARAGVQARLVAVDAHLAYYYRRTFVERLRADVIAPARVRGVDRIWLVGISLGGTGSILYSIEHPGDVSGVALFAPFLGEEAVRREVEEAGGLRPWTPRQPHDPSDFQRRMWVWLDRYQDGSEGKMPIYLGWGARDRFAPTNRLLAEVLPPERVLETSGGHDWRAWRRLWERFLATGALRGL